MAQGFGSGGTTTDATPKTIPLFTVPDGEADLVDLSLVAKSDANDLWTWNGKQGVARPSGGAPQLVGTTTVIHNQRTAGASSWAISALITGNQIALQVTGAAGANITWRIDGSRAVN